MPGGDGTGPMGGGPMTGRQAGYCAGFPVPGYQNPMPGRGWGFGRGWGRGYAPMPQAGWLGSDMGPYYGTVPIYAPPSAEMEMQALKGQAENLENTLENMRKRISELEAAQEKEG